MKNYVLLLGASLAAMMPVAALAADQSAPSQEGATDPVYGDIVVQARKRAEASIAVPVVVTAVGQETIENKAINRLEKVARNVPGFLVTNTSTAAGGVIAIRGISSSEANPFADQSVSFNVDGAQFSRAFVTRLGQFDMQQVEVLKGPQALYFGKNSPGGIISLRTADPTDKLEAKLSAGYEFKADEVRLDGFVSGPLTETLGARLAFYASHMKGYMRADTSAPAPFVADDARGPKAREYAGRLTLKFEPSEIFDAKLKVSFNRMKDNGPNANVEIVHCQIPGLPQYYTAPTINGFTSNDCEADGRNMHGDLPSTMASVHPTFGEENALRQRQALAVLEMNVNLDQLTLTSVSAYYNARARYHDNSNDVAGSAVHALATYQNYGTEEISQELRLRSDFDGPINFVTGAYYQHVKLDTLSITGYGAGPPYLSTPIFVPNESHLFQKTNAYSAFGQVTVKPIETLELSAGGRYSHEAKRVEGFGVRTGLPLPIQPTRPKRSFNNFSPEFTINWRPTDRLTVFGSYKKGFLSGGFNGAAVPLTGFGGDKSYDQQLIKGFEGGIKAALLGNTLRVNLAAFDYKITGLQTAVLTATPTGIVTNVANAGESYTRGIEGDFAWRTPISGLTITGALAYLKARYKEYLGPCYRGQTFEQGCDVAPAGSPVGLLQDQSGLPLARAPKWAGNIGFDFETPVGSELKFGLSSSLTFNSTYTTQTDNKPFGRMRAYRLLDATAKIGAEDDRWELALIGVNLTNKRYYNRTSDAAFSGRGTNGCHVTATAPTDRLCGMGSASNLPADIIAITGRPREVMIRATYRF